jgi:acetyltransferase-like isoleucine patch superfamily enzyme
MTKQLIHPTALVDEGVVLGNNVSIGPYTIVHKNVRIGDNTVVESHCELGHPASRPELSTELVIGNDSLIRSHSIFYLGSEFKTGLVTGHRVTVREKTKAGCNFQIGTLSDIQGHCTVGDFVRFHSNVHVGQKSKIGDFVWIFPYVVLTNDPTPPSNTLKGVTIQQYAAISTMSVILPGVTVGEGALVGAHSSVTKDVEANTVVVGSPAKAVCYTSQIQLKDGSNRPAYPWRRHFHRGYEQQIVERWLTEFPKEEQYEG